MERKDFAPLSFWAWNNEMDDESIRQRIGEFHQQGLNGFFMHARAGNETEYLSDDWFRACRTCVEEAKKYDMEVWIYDEDGWPSGFAGGKVSGLGEKYQAKYICFTDQEEEADEQRLISCYVTENGKRWFYYKAEPNYVDLLSKEVTRAFIKVTHQRYYEELKEDFGKTVKGIFTDEPQLSHMGYPYSLELEEYFTERNGYSFAESIHYLADTMEEMDGNEASRRFRRDYWNTVEEMMRLHFAKQIYDWCEEHQVKFTGHFPGEDSLIHQISSTAGVMPKYQYMHMPGIDHLGRRITPPLLIKQVTSAARQYGKEKVISETFGCAGWNVSFGQMCHIWGWQAGAGINVPCLHIGAHSIKGIRKRDYPAFYSYQEPWWDAFHHVSDWMTGLNEKMSRGKRKTDVLVISPMQSIYLLHRMDRNAQEQALAAQYRQLLENLLDVQVDFDIGDERVMEEIGAVENGKVRVGRCSYEKVIVADARMLEKNTWQLFEQFEQQGGDVIFTNRVPEGGREKKRAVIPNRRSFWYKYFERDGYQRPIVFFEKNGFHVAPDLFVSLRDEGRISRVYVWNKEGSGERELIGRFPGRKQCVQVNPENGERHLLRSRQEGLYTYVTLTVVRQASYLLEFVDEAVDAVPEAGEVLCSRKLEMAVELLEMNSLTVDYASFSLDGENYSEEYQVVRMHEPLYEAIPDGGDVDIYVKYHFTSGCTSGEKRSLCAESDHLTGILCNGAEVGEQGGWFIDRCIKEYDISKYVRQGENEIVLVYHVPVFHKKQVDGLFETEVNRFFYPVEPEAIYIRGDFDVAFSGWMENRITHLRLSDGHFSLQAKTAKQPGGDFTRQGLWFYRGDVILHAEVEKSKGRQFLQLKGLKAAMAEVSCEETCSQDRKKAVYMEPYEVEITDLLKEGKNQILIRLYGTNRNILGPHHHAKGENNYVGVNSFKGVYGYEDIIVNFDLKEKDTWTDDYSFVEFGLEGVYLKIKE